jgi:predicted ATPase
MTLGFSRLSVRGYRRLRSVDLSLRPFNVLIGANGVGKSSILDILHLLASSASGRLESTMTDLGGLTSLLTADGKTNALGFQLRSIQEAATSLSYDVRLEHQGFGYTVKDEVLTEFGDPPPQQPAKYIDTYGEGVAYWNEGKPVPPNWDYKYQETALSQAPRMYKEAEGFRRLVANVSEIYHSLDVSTGAPVRLPQIVSPAQIPGPDGKDLVSCLYTISQTARDRFEIIEDVLRAAIPTFERLDFPPVAAGRITVAWQDRGFTRPFYGNELSEGTLRFLWLATLLQSPGLPMVTLIDEPEVSLQPEMLRLLADLMREASDRTQLVVATHSDRFVRFLEPAEIVVCDRDDAGGMSVLRADEIDLTAWMEDYTLDQLWSMGRLGGRP